MFMKELSLSQKLQQLSIEDLNARLEGMRRDLFGLRVNTVTKKVKDYSQYKKLRKHVARIMTAIRAKTGALVSVKKS
jgi:ribosomal protein L29